uniref:RNase H type-1 domain-containing protein n=1 Tax=Leersia perrieri TaxID=77586 RepID=A0A0D9WC88_9ORYZ
MMRRVKLTGGFPWPRSSTPPPSLPSAPVPSPRLRLPDPSNSSAAAASPSPSSAIFVRPRFISTLPPPPTPPSTLSCYRTDKLPNLPHFPITYGDPVQLKLQFDQDVASLVHQGLDLQQLKQLYYDLVRPVLLSSGLLMEDSIDSPNTRALDNFLCTNFKKHPIYLSSLDVMKALIGLDTDKWCYLMRYLRINRILVCENWLESFGNVECVVHDDSINFSSATSETIYKGQCDAGYKKGSANLWTIIMTGINKILDCAIIRGVPCESAPHAELWAMYVLLRRAIDMGVIRLLNVKTDSKFVADTLCEKYVLKPDAPPEDICEALRCMKSYFKRFGCRWEPRENLFLVDSLLKMEGEALQNIEAIKDIWADYLLDTPQFRAHQERGSFKKNYIKKAQPVGSIYLHRMYKVAVEDCLEKRVEAIGNILLSLLPPSATILVEDYKTALVLKEKLESIEGLVEQYWMTVKDIEGCCILHVLSVKTMEGLVDRKLDVICGAQLGGEYMAIDDSLRVKILTSMEDDATLPELSAVCFLYFHGKDPIDL